MRREASSSPPPGFFQGIVSPFRGMGFLLGNITLARFLIFPWIITFIISGALYYAAFEKYDTTDWLMSWWDEPTKVESPPGTPWYKRAWRAVKYAVPFATHWVLEVLMGSILFLLCIFAGFLLGQLLASPFYTRLSYHTRRRYLEGDVVPAGGIFADVFNPVLIQLGRLIVFIVLHLALFTLFIIPVAGAVMYTFFGTILTLFFIAFDFFDYALDTEPVALPVKKRMAFVNRNRPMALGFASTMMGFLAIPILNIFLLPIGVIGATLLYCDHVAAVGPPSQTLYPV